MTGAVEHNDVHHALPVGSLHDATLFSQVYFYTSSYCFSNYGDLGVGVLGSGSRNGLLGLRLMGACCLWCRTFRAFYGLGIFM